MVGNECRATAGSIGLGRSSFEGKALVAVHYVAVNLHDLRPLLVVLHRKSMYTNALGIFFCLSR